MSVNLISRFLRGVGAFGLASLASVAACSSAAAAAAIVDANGFENPPFIAGTLEGQNGWRNSVIGSNASTATIQGAIKLSGNQALQVDRAANSDERWGLPVSGYPSNRFVDIEWDMRVAEATTLELFGPFFGVEAYDDNGVFGLIGSLGVDATTGDVLYQIEDSGVLTETGQRITFNTWNNFVLRLDFASNSYTAFFNGTPVATTGFVDRGIGGNDLDELSDASISAIAASFDVGSQALTGRAYFDNFAVYDIDAADFNFDLVVDDADYGIWETSFGVDDGGDANADGRTDGLDLMIWQREYGAGIGASVAAAAISGAPVPEPHALALCGLGGLAALGRRKR